jgi:hypothetical protein
MPTATTLIAIVAAAALAVVIGLVIDDVLAVRRDRAARDESERGL